MTHSEDTIYAEVSPKTGLGVDIVEIERMRIALERTPRMKRRIFTDDERWYCEHKKKPEIHYALRFAAKEAVWKALGTGFRGMCFQDVEIVRDKFGRPEPLLKGKAREIADEAGILEIALSLSFTHTTAIAGAVAITADDRPKKELNPDRKEVIARKFKEMRGMLDGELKAIPEAEPEEAELDPEAESAGYYDYAAEESQKKED